MIKSTVEAGKRSVASKWKGHNFTGKVMYWMRVLPGRGLMDVGTGYGRVRVV